MINRLIDVPVDEEIDLYLSLNQERYFPNVRVQSYFPKQAEKIDLNDFFKPINDHFFIFPRYGNFFHEYSRLNLEKPTLFFDDELEIEIYGQKFEFRLEDLSSKFDFNENEFFCSSFSLTIKKESPQREAFNQFICENLSSNHALMLKEIHKGIRNLLIKTYIMMPDSSKVKALAQELKLEIDLDPPVEQNIFTCFKNTPERYYSDDMAVLRKILFFIQKTQLAKIEMIKEINDLSLPKK